MGGGKEVVKLLVGNKVDQPRVIQRDVADDWARSRGMLFMEASAKTKEGISQVFIEVVQKVNLRRISCKSRLLNPNGVVHCLVVINIDDSLCLFGSCILFFSFQCSSSSLC